MYGKRVVKIKKPVKLCHIRQKFQILIKFRGFSNLCLFEENIVFSTIYDARMTGASNINTEFSRACFMKFT